MQATPPEYSDLIGEIGLFLGARAQKLRAAWIDPRRIVLDPGFGFGKTADQNFQLLRRLSSLRSGGYPLLIGLSRKNMIGQATGRPVGDRLSGSIAAALACVAQMCIRDRPRTPPDAGRPASRARRRCRTRCSC